MFQSLDQLLGLVATVGLDVADDHIEAALEILMSFAEHRVGLTDTCRRPEEDFQTPSTLRTLGHGTQQRIGVGSRMSQVIASLLNVSMLSIDEPRFLMTF